MMSESLISIAMKRRDLCVELESLRKEYEGLQMEYDRILRQEDAESIAKRYDETRKRMECICKELRGVENRLQEAINEAKGDNQ